MQEKVIPTAVCPSDDHLFYALISPEAVELADAVIRIAQRLNAHDARRLNSQAHERDVLDLER
jgi:hypothetical protein